MGTGAGDMRARLGLLQPGENIQIQYRFDEATLRKIVHYETVERKQQHLRELLAVDIMERRGLPSPPAHVANNMRNRVKDAIARSAGVLESRCLDEDWFQDCCLDASCVYM